MNITNEQQDIFDYIKGNNGNLVVSAKAGSGKTTTILKTLELLKPREKVLLLAFNKSVVAELEKRVEKIFEGKVMQQKPNIHISTLHSLGMGIIGRHNKNLGLKFPRLDNNKYDKYLQENLHVISESKISYSSAPEFYIKNIMDLCNLGRCYHAINVRKMKKVVDKYDIPVAADEINVALEMIWWGSKCTEVIDNTDMVFIPVVENMSCHKYNMVYLDEAQDANIIQRKLMSKSIIRGGRFVAIGDEKQAIYGFAGASEESFRELANEKNTVTMPLSICYRCSKNIIKFTQKKVSDIYAREDAPWGKVEFNTKLSEIQSGDMVLCRNSEPLVKLFVWMLEQGIKCHIKGAEQFHHDILSFINKISDFSTQNEMYTAINTFLDSEITKINTIGGEDMVAAKRAEVNEMCKMLLYLNTTNKSKMREKINDIFGKSEEGICLTTVHKAKGLEADNVFILAPRLLLGEQVTKDWEKQQEENLAYVAYTRAKNNLYFIDKDELDVY